MVTPQVLLRTGLGPRTTAGELVAGLELTGRTVVVTGGYSGLGLETVRVLAGAGADVVVPARRPDPARQALADVTGSIEVLELDLADLASVATAADGMLASGRSIDVLINNAAVMACPETRVGPGWEAQLATNHLGHFAFTNRLWPALVADGGARVISLSSTGHKLSAFRFDDPQFTEGYDKWKAYGQAKTANSLFAVQLDRLGRTSGVRAFGVHPGGIMTPLQRHLPREEMVAAGWIDVDGNVNERFKTVEQGAATSVWAATSARLAGEGGVYCEDCDIAAPTDVGSPTARWSGFDAHAVDPDAAVRLWALSAELTGTDAFA